MELFGRNVELQIGEEGRPGKTFSDIRVSFRVAMSRSQEPNKATIQAYNLNADSLTLFQNERATIVRLKAGYGTPKLIFEGNPIKDGVKLVHQGPDKILQIDAKDGGRKYRDSRVDVALATQVTGQQVLDRVVAAMQIPKGTIQLDQTLKFTNGFMFSGPARDVLDRLAAMSGADWFIRDGALQMIKKGKPTGELGLLFSAKAGNLIGNPKPTDTGIEVTGLLDPNMRPGKKFRVDSELYRGDYVATDVEFQGDSGWEGAFYVIVRGTPL